MLSQLESKVLCFRVPKRAPGGVLGTPKVSPHAMFLKPGQRLSAEFSVTENGGSVPCWWASESSSTPRFGDRAMVTRSAAVGLSPAPAADQYWTPCLLSVTSLPCRAKQRSDCWLLRSGSVEGIALLQRSLVLAGLMAEAAPQGNFQWLRHGQLSRAVSHFSDHFNSRNRVTFKKVNAGICQATNHKETIRDYLAACDLVPQHHEAAAWQTRASTSSFASLMRSSRPSRCHHCIPRAGHRSTLSPAGHQGHAPGTCPRGASVVLLPGPQTPSSKGSTCTKGPATWDMNLPCKAILPCSSFQQEQPTPAPPESSRGQDVASQCHWRGFQSLHLFKQNVPREFMQPQQTRAYWLCSSQTLQLEHVMLHQDSFPGIWEASNSFFLKHFLYSKGWSSTLHQPTVKRIRDIDKCCRHQ